MVGGLAYLTDGCQWIANPYGLLERVSKNKGITFVQHLPVIGKVLFTGDPTLIEEIVGNEALEAGRAISILNKALGERSLITLDGKDHKERKKLLAPLMAEKNLTRFDKLTVSLTRKFLSEQPTDQPFSAYDTVREISLRVIVELLFGKDDFDQSEKIIAAANAFLNSFQTPLPLLLPPLRVDLGPVSPWGKALRRRKMIEAYVLQKLESKIERDGDETSLLDRVKTYREGGGILPTQEIAAEALALLAFGHDTAAATLAWAFHHIYSANQLVERLSSPAMTEQDFNLLLESALNESMRLCPVVVHLSRKAVSRTSVGRHEVNVGQLVAPSAYLAHRNPEVYENSNNFDADRFLRKQPSRYSYFPFGLGNRTCFGKPLAYRQMLLILSTAIKEFRLGLRDHGPAIAVRKMVLVLPRHGTMLVRHG